MSLAGAIPNLETGTPGCLRFILERPMSDALAAKLKPNCLYLRAAYLGSLETYSSSPEQFRAEISAAIQANRKPEPAYRAIVMAALFEDKTLVPALQARARLERSKRWRYAYAAAALERIQKGECSKQFRETSYDEVCRLQSALVTRLIALNRVIAAEKAKVRK